MLSKRYLLLLAGVFCFTLYSLAAPYRIASVVRSLLASKLSSLNPDVIDNGIFCDGPAVTSEEERDQVPLICLDDIQIGPKAKNILFAHGTGANGNASFQSGLAHAFAVKGYTSCWYNMPNKSVDDAQLTSEYVAHFIKKLYRLSENSPIFVLGHSQGTLNIQWALNFFPSTRKMVSSFVALSADFHGTDTGPLFALAQGAFINGTVPSVLQQSVIEGEPSRFLKALHKHGNIALVPTTSIFGRQDEVVQPIVQSTMLDLGGAAFSHIATSELCPGQLMDHVDTLTSRVPFFLALDAFHHRSAANIERLRQSQSSDHLCREKIAPGVVEVSSLVLMQQYIDLGLAVSLAGYGTPSGAFSFQTKVEPALVPYAANQP